MDERDLPANCENGREPQRRRREDERTPLDGRANLPAPGPTQDQTASLPPAAGESPFLSQTPARHFPEIEGYRIVGILGRGGMGTVYRAVQTALDRTVALKILPAGLIAAGPEHVKRFEREARAAARLHHTNIVPIYDSGESNDGCYYAMELITGRPLDAVIRYLAESDVPHASPTRLVDSLRDFLLTFEGLGAPSESQTFPDWGSAVSSSTTGHGRYYYKQVARWMADVADALHYAHGQGIIHRDIKPSNLILAVDGRMMIADFGLARFAGDRSVTMPGALLGTLRYMSPEQAMAKRVRVDHRTDIWSLGVTLYELLTFRSAFEGDDDKEIMARIIAREPTPPRKLASAVPHELQTICLKTLEKSPDHRYPTARALAEDLRRYLHDMPIAARSPGPLLRAWKLLRRHRTLSATSFVVVVAALTIGALLRFHQGRQFTSYLDLARESTERQAWANADKAFRNALEIDSSHGKTYIDYARMKFSQYKAIHGQQREAHLQKALDLCTSGLELTPDDVLGHNVLGAILREQDKTADAIEAFSKAARLDDTRFFTWVNLGTVQAVDGQFAAARRSLEKAAELAEQVINPDHLPYTVDVWRNLASLQLFAGEPEAAVTIERALQADRRDFASLALRARLRLAEQDWQSARDDATQALRESEGRFAPAARLQALAYLGQRDFERAERRAMKAIELGDLPALNGLIIANAEAQTGRADLSRRHMDETEATFPPELKSSVCRCLITGRNNILWIDRAADLESLRESTRKHLEAQPQS